jgi:hypothetical protein
MVLALSICTGTRVDNPKMYLSTAHFCTTRRLLPTLVPFIVTPAQVARPRLKSLYRKEQKMPGSADRIMDVGIQATRGAPSPELARVGILLSFDRCLLLKGGLITVTETYAACTGARVKFFSKDFEITRYTRSVELEAKYLLQRQKAESQEAGSTLKVAVPEIFTADVATRAETLVETSSQTEFRAQESSLSAILDPSRREVRWSLYMHRGGKAVKDFLEGNVDLEVIGKVEEPQTMVSVHAQPTDRRFFGPDFTPLSPRASFGLWVKLKLRGRDIPGSRRLTKYAFV